MPRRGVSVRGRYGSRLRPVRGSGDMLVNSPGGWMASNGPVPWGADVSGGNFWWVGKSVEDGYGPVGPNGPWSQGFEALAVVTRATSLIVDPLTTGEFRVVERTAEGPRTHASSPRWLSDPQLMRPDARVNGSPLLPAGLRSTRSVFWRAWLRFALHEGSSWLLFQEDPLGQPLPGSMVVLPSAAVESDGGGYWRLADANDDEWWGFDGRTEVGGVVYRLLRLENPHTPLGVFAQHPAVFRIGRSLSGYTEGTFASGVPSGVLRYTGPELDQESADLLRARWMEAHGGDRRSVAVLNSTLEFAPLSISPVDAALVEVARLSLAQAAFAFNMAPETLSVSIGGSMTYSNIRDWFEAHRDFALSPWIAAVEGVLSSLLPAGQEVAVNLDAYTQPTMSQTIADGQAAVAAGLSSPQEWRVQRMGLPPEPLEVADAAAT